MVTILLIPHLLAAIAIPCIWVKRVLRKYNEPADRYREQGSGSDLSDPLAVSDGDIYPNILKIADGYGASAERITAREDLRAELERLPADPDEPYLLNVIVDAEENVYPMIPAGGTYRNVIMGDEEVTRASSDVQGANI